MILTFAPRRYDSCVPVKVMYHINVMERVLEARADLS